MLKPQHLVKGDTVAIVSLSSGLLGESVFIHKYDIAKQRLEKNYGLHVVAMPNALKGIDYLYKKVLRPKIVGPAFIYNYPVIMQPLARVSDADEQIVEQFQLLVNGWEICKAYSELVDPILQQENFDLQAEASKK